MRVLTAFDESKYSVLAIDYLKQLPCHEEIDLTLASVLPEIPAHDLTGTRDAIDRSELIRGHQETTLARLSESAAFLREDFKSVSPRLTTGSPGRRICDLARKIHPDLIAAGAIGHSAIARVLLGSTSDYIATHADCSVLVIRPAPKPSAEPHVPLSPPQRVLVAISNAATDEKLWRWIGRLKLPRSTEIRLVHLMQTFPFDELDLLKKASAYWKAVRSVASKRIDKLLPQLQSLGYRVDSGLVEAPHVGQAIINDVEIEHCDLVILGNRRESLAVRGLLGSTSRHVLRHARCSVLISRE